MTMMELLTTMAEGNPGAINVLLKLVKDDPAGMFLILDLDDMGLRGSQIWVAYKDGCMEDLEKLRAFCKSRDQKIINIVNQQCPDLPQAATGGKS
jgi:hypothetical protein